MAQGLIIIHLGRCGSTVLSDLLSQHSQISWSGEILEPLLQTARRTHGNNFVLKVDPVTLASDAIATCPTPFCGIEFKPFHINACQMSLSDFISGMRHSGIENFVVLDRRNRLRKVVSSRLAAASGIWHVPAHAKRETHRVALSVDMLKMDYFTGTLIEILEMYETQFKELRKLVSPNHLDLIYEDHIETDPEVGYRKVLTYFGLPYESITVNLGRTSSGSLHTDLENYDEVAEHLAGTQFAWMLDC